MAFQGLVRDSSGNAKSEIFVVDIGEHLVNNSSDTLLLGTEKSLPSVPVGIGPRRITYTRNGVSLTPRHWLRSTPNGDLIGFLAKDHKGVIQLFGVSPNGGAIRQLSFLPYSIEGQFNFSPDGRYAAFIADGSIFINHIETGNYTRLTERTEGLIGAAVWSPKGDAICYNKYIVGNDGQRYLQIFLAKWK